MMWSVIPFLVVVKELYSMFDCTPTISWDIEVYLRWFRAIPRFIHFYRCACSGAR
jgi:hypothetical protein